mmetsp:Transcript_9855/g.24772  ORF Transcript_9855/g.24772 Transcript_9855/m.24772 type:complete len:248 (-) Transcript_9855:4068-4811(-)
MPIVAHPAGANRHAAARKAERGEQNQQQQPEDGTDDNPGDGAATEPTAPAVADVGTRGRPFGGGGFDGDDIPGDKAADEAGEARGNGHVGGGKGGCLDGLGVERVAVGATVCAGEGLLVLDDVSLRGSGVSGRLGERRRVAARHRSGLRVVVAEESAEASVGQNVRVDVVNIAGIGEVVPGFQEKQDLRVIVGCSSGSARREAGLGGAQVDELRLRADLGRLGAHHCDFTDIPRRRSLTGLGCFPAE